MRRFVIMMVLTAVAAAGCGVPFIGEGPVELEALKDPNVRQYVPAKVPDGYRLWYVQPIADAETNTIVGAETLYEGGDLGIITVCATGNADVARHQCRADTLAEEQVRIIDRGEKVTVTTHCSSDSCTDFKPGAWLEHFGTTPPAPPSRGEG